MHPYEDPAAETADLHKRIDHLTALVTEMAERQNRMVDAWDEAMPILKEAMDVAVVRLDDLEKRGYFRNGRAALAVLDRVMSGYSEDDIHQLGNSAVAILDTVRNLTQPEVLSIANEATEVLHSADRIKPLSVGGAWRASRDEDVQRGMAVLFEMMRHVGRAASHLEHGSAPPARAAAPSCESSPAPLQPSSTAAPAAAPTPGSEEVVFEGLRFRADGTLLEPEGWTRDLAEKLAPTVGVAELTETHWQVIDFARAEHAQTGKSPNIRRITQGAGVTTRELYALFPQAPGRAVARVAGLPKPAGCL